MILGDSMLGAIIGDIAGSLDEYQEFKDSLNKTINGATDKIFRASTSILFII